MWRGRLVASTAVLSVLLVPGGAQAATTVGSPLTTAPSGGLCGGTPGSGAANTYMSVALAAGTLQAPFDGFVVRWRLRLSAPGGSSTYELRVLRPVGSSYMGVGTGPPQTAPSSGVNELTLPSPLPIKAGDQIGVDCMEGAPSPFTNAAPMASRYGFFNPRLADGDTKPPNNTFAFDEELVNADIASKPSNAFSFGGLARNKHKGTATLAVNVPGPGTLVLAGKGVKARQAAGGAVAKMAVAEAGTVELPIKPKGKTRRKLQRAGKARVKVSVTYTPNGEIAGDPNTQSEKIKLIKKP
jgi:hypothetical protein